MKPLFSILLLVAIVSCRDHSNMDEQTTFAVMEHVQNAPLPPAQVSMVEHKQVLIYEASLNLLVSNIKAVNDSLKRILPEFEAHVSNETSFGYESSREQKMEIRVIEQNFYGLVARLESLGIKTINRELDI